MKNLTQVGLVLLLIVAVGAVVSAIRQLDDMTGTGYNSHRGQSMRR